MARRRKAKVETGWGELSEEQRQAVYSRAMLWVLDAAPLAPWNPVMIGASQAVSGPEEKGGEVVYFSGSTRPMELATGSMLWHLQRLQALAATARTWVRGGDALAAPLVIGG